MMRSSNPSTAVPAATAPFMAIMAIVAIVVMVAVGCDQRPTPTPATASEAETPAPIEGSAGSTPRTVGFERYEEPATDPKDPRVAVLLHGYGSNEKDLVGLARRAGLAGPVISLRAPVPAGNGRAWFPIDFDSEPRYAPNAADDVLVRLANELRQIRQNHPEMRVVVLGFSQGAMMAMLLAVEHPDALDQAIALSGTLPRPPQPPDDFDPADAPLIYAIHGTADRVVTLERGRQAQMWLEEAGAEPTYNEYDGMGHRVDDAVVNDLRNYLSLPESE